jgi:hypothetical protein
LRGSGFDTKLAVYAGCSCPVGAPPIACNDDFWGPHSEVVFPAVAGEEYLIRIGGVQNEQGWGYLTIRCCSTDVCSFGETWENEPCGADSNGGCGSISPLSNPVDFGDTVCGSVWAENGATDIDMYQKTFAETTGVTWMVSAEFPLKIAILDSACSVDTIVRADTLACAGTLVSSVLPPGTYNFLVTTSHTDGLPCFAGPRKYMAELLPCNHLKGDLDGNKQILPSDVVYILHCVFIPYPPEYEICEPCFTDLNCDGDISPADAVLELNLVFLNQPPFPCQ